MANKVEIIINADGTRAIKALKDVGATAAATGKANADAAKVSQLAAKFEGDTISAESVKIVQAREKQRLASAEYAKIQALVRKGATDEATGTTAVAAAYQRLTAAKLLTAKASEAHISAMKGESKEWMTLREHFGNGLSAAGSFAVGNIPEIAAFAGLAGMLGELKSAVSETLEFGEAIQRASEKTGLAAGTLSVLHYAAKVTGGDFDKMTMAIGKMGASIGAAADGNDKKASAFLKSLGLDAKQLADQSDGVEIAFKRVGSAIADTENPTRRLELANGLLRKGGQEMIPTLLQLGTRWDEWTQKTKDAGRYLTELSAGQLEQTNQKLKALQEHIDGAKVSLAEGFTPALAKMIDVLEGGKGPMDAMKTIGEDLGKTFAFVAETVYSLAAGLEILFAAGEGSGLTEAGRRDTAAANRFLDKAQAMHDIAFPGKTGNSQHVVEGVGKTGLVGMSGEVVGTAGPRQKRPGDAESFTGIGDLTGGADKAAQKRLKAMEAELAQDRLNSDMSAKAVYDFWDRRKDAFKVGSEQYNAIVEKQAQLAVEGASKAHELIKQFKEKQLREEVDGARELAQATKDANKAMRDMDMERFEDQRAAFALLRNAAESNLQAELKMQEIRLRIFGNSAGANARKTADLHRKEYDSASANVADQVKSVNGDPYLTDKEKNQQLQRLGDEQNRLDRERDLQALEDQKRIESTTLMGGLNDALRDFTLEATDAGAKMKEFFSNALGTTNSAIIKMLTEPSSQTRGQHVFGQAGHEIFTSAAGSLLKGAEGKLMSAFGLGGKKDGQTEANALYVQMSNKANAGALSKIGLPGVIPFNGSSGGGSGGQFGDGEVYDPKWSNDDGDDDGTSSVVKSGFAGFLAKLTGKGSASDGTSSGFGAFLHALHIPGFADGGNYPPNSLIMVGERGEEIMQTGSTGGRIIPNHALGGGGGHTIHNNLTMHVGAGVDEGAMSAIAQREFARAAPEFAKQSARGISEALSRSPSSRRPF